MAKATGIVQNQAEIAEKMTEKVESDARFAEVYNHAQNLQLQLEEQMTSLSLLLDSQGWTELTQYNTDGPQLWQLQEAGRKLRNLAGLNAHMGRGKRQRHAYIWKDGLHHDKVPGGRQGQTNVQRIIEDPINQANYFGPLAREKQEAALYTNGMYVVVGEDAVRNTPKRLRPLPMYQITAHMVNPDDPAEIWALRRSWSSEGIIANEPNQLSSASGDLKHEWIFVHEHKDRETAKVKHKGGDEAVNREKRVFLEMVNVQDGWTWGLPDAIAAMAWADQYRKGTLNGLKMQEALATLAFKLKSQTTRGANAAAAKVAATTEKGGTAAMPDGMDIAALATAGQGYDFDSLRPVLAIVATSLDISVVALSSDPGSAGSSYGAGSLLDLPTRLAMMARREIHVEFEKKVLSWLGAPDARVWFNSLTDGTELYRGVQSILLKWNTGMYAPEEIKTELEALFGHEQISAVPSGILLPNNEKSLPRRDIDTDTKAPATTPSPNQGQSDGVGGDGNVSGNDIRDDGI